MSMGVTSETQATGGRVLLWPGPPGSRVAGWAGVASVLAPKGLGLACPVPGLRPAVFMPGHDGGDAFGGHAVQVQLESMAGRGWDRGGPRHSAASGATARSRCRAREDGAMCLPVAIGRPVRHG